MGPGVRWKAVLHMTRVVVYKAEHDMKTSSETTPFYPMGNSYSPRQSRLDYHILAGHNFTGLERCKKLHPIQSSGQLKRVDTKEKAVRSFLGL